MNDKYKPYSYIDENGEENFVYPIKIIHGKSRRNVFGFMIPEPWDDIVEFAVFCVLVLIGIGLSAAAYLALAYVCNGV